MNAALASSTFASDPLTFGPTKIVGGQNQGAHATAQQVKGGDIHVVSPEAFADRPAIFPRPKV